ncbi:MAG: gephyrin-like molybdotransferase Glp [Hyphomicrobiaceae bacterium]
MGGPTAARPLQSAIPLADALARVLPHLSPVRASEIISISDARNRIVVAPVLAPIDLPRDDLAAMDGYAVRTVDLVLGASLLQIIGTAAAGHPFDGTVCVGEAVRILTGAVLPAGSDRVIPQENCEVLRDKVQIDGTAIGKSHRRRRGEDVPTGSLVFPAGHRLRTFDLVLASALGIETVQAMRQVRVGLFSSGDELQPAGAVLQRGQIWDINRVLLPSLLGALGCLVHDYGIIRDEPAILEGALMGAARDCDLLVTTGGVSVGSEDYIRSVIGRRGALEVWRLALKPGKPIGFGDIDDCPILALPGNPLAALVAFVAFARPVINVLRGSASTLDPGLMLPAGLAQTKKRGIRQYLLANVVAGPDGTSIIVPVSRQSPSQISPLTAAQGLAVLPENLETIVNGSSLEFISFETLLL